MGEKTGAWAAVWPLIAAGVLAVLAIASCWPGIAEYDSVEQFRQALSGHYDDWHPPAMARLWAVLHGAFGGGAAPMLVLQTLLYWLGLGLIAGALAQSERPRAAGAVLLLGALPVFVIWQMIVLKDTQMLGAVLAAIGMVAWWRLRGLRVPYWAWAAAAVLLGYAMIVRANGVFAIVPLAVMLAPGVRWPVRLGAIAALTLAVLAVEPVINRDMMLAEDSGVRSTEPLYDLSGIAVRVDDPSATGLTAANVAALRGGRCVKSFFWDPLGTDGPCSDPVAGLHERSIGSLYATLAVAALHHPAAYAAHRLAHLNSTDRWLVPTGWPDAWGETGSEPNDLGLGGPGWPAVWYVDATRPIAETPVAWPIVWLMLALIGLVTALRRMESPLRDLALALLVSAVAMEASFAAVSIASDLRYHLWPMIAAGLGTILLVAEARPSRRTWAIGGVVLALVVAGGTASRLTLPRAPAGYEAMLAS